MTACEKFVQLFVGKPFPGFRLFIKLYIFDTPSVIFFQCTNQLITLMLKILVFRGLNKRHLTKKDFQYHGCCIGIRWYCNRWLCLCVFIPNWLSKQCFWANNGAKAMAEHVFVDTPQSLSSIGHTILHRMVTHICKKNTISKFY